jgi:tripartite-type tricarboxylate transporter receptor subunit TctC
MKRLVRALVLFIALGAALEVIAQGYPDKPIHFIVPFPPGGGTDTFARIVGAKLTDMLGPQVIVDNRGGAQGNIGTALGAKAAPDGYTITLAYLGTLAVNPHLYSNPGFDPFRDFAAISRGTEEIWVLVVHPSVPVKTIKELADLAKRNPGKLAFASSASGTQLVGELFKLTTGTNIVHVPYKGAGPAVIDLVAGNVGIMFSNPTAAVPHVKSGRLRALAVMGDKRIEALPHVPSAVEAGYPELNVVSWYGVVVPALTPREVIVKLNAAIVRALDSPDVVERLRAVGQIPSPSTPEQFAEQIRIDFERWGKVVKATGAKVD